MMKILLQLVILSLTRRFGDGVILNVMPATIEPDVTPSFSLACALVDSEEFNVVNMSISRQKENFADQTTSINPSFQSPELVAYLDYTRPSLPFVEGGFQSVTAMGQLATLESEMETYLNLFWPAPSLEDLGLYACSVTFATETGQLMTRTAEALVTSANPGMYRLLLTVNSLQTQISNFNSQLQEMNTTMLFLAERIENITRSDPDEPEMDEENAETEQENDNGAENGETNEEAETDLIVDFFRTENSSYVLVRSTIIRDAHYARAACSGKQLDIAAIDTETEFREVASQIAPIMQVGDLVVIAGQRLTGPNRWTIQDTNRELGQPSEHRDSECIVLRKKRNFLTDQTDIVMAAVPCSMERTNFLYLCEGER